MRMHFKWTLFFVADLANATERAELIRLRIKNMFRSQNHWREYFVCIKNIYVYFDWSKNKSHHNIGVLVCTLLKLWASPQAHPVERINTSRLAAPTISFSWNFKHLTHSIQVQSYVVVIFEWDLEQNTIWNLKVEFKEKNMVAKIDLISEASHKHAGEVTALVFDGEHLYSGSADGVISVRNLWDFSELFFSTYRFDSNFIRNFWFFKDCCIFLCAILIQITI